MGVTISHKLGQTKPNIKATLDQAEKTAKLIDEHSDVGVKIRHREDTALFIDVDGCETLAFEFQSVKKIMGENGDGYSYKHAVLTDDGARKLDEGYEIKEYPENEKWYSADFCKTQFADNIIAHKIVADLIKVVAGRCFYAEVSDEGDYYHTGKLGDAVRAIRENGKIIDSVTGALTGQGWKKEQIHKGGETKIGK